MTWQDAVAQLSRERTLAETCVGVLKRYGEAAAEYDGVISGLAVCECCAGGVGQPSEGCGGR